MLINDHPAIVVNNSICLYIDISSENPKHSIKAGYYLPQIMEGETEAQGD